MAVLQTDLWAEGGLLAPGESEMWYQQMPKGRVKWFIAYPNNNPGLMYRLEITSVVMRQLPSGVYHVNVTVTNVGTEWAQYRIYFAEAVK